MKYLQRLVFAGSYVLRGCLAGRCLMFLTLLLIPLPNTGCANPQIEEVKAEKGILDLSIRDAGSSHIINLDGEWEFYWNRLFDPADFAGENVPEMTSYMQVPGCWDAERSSGPVYPATGCATYRLRVKTGDNYQLYGLMVPETLTSYKLWVNGELAAETGRVSENPAEMQPQYAKRVVYYEPREGELDIIWQVANSNYRKSGIWLSIKAGRHSRSAHYMTVDRGGDIPGGMPADNVPVSYRFVYISPQGSNSSVLRLFCLIIVMRILTTGELLLETTIPSFNWEIARKMELSAFYAGGTFFMLFLHSVFPRDLNLRIIQVLAVIAGAMGLFVLAAPVRLGNHLVVPLEIVVMAGLLYLLAGVLSAAYHRRKGSIYILFGFMTVILAAVNDILYSNAIIMTFYMIPFALLILIFSQSLMLAMRFSESFSTVEKLSENLTDINASMKRFVPYEFLNYLGMTVLLMWPSGIRLMRR